MRGLLRTSTAALVLCLGLCAPASAQDTAAAPATSPAAPEPVAAPLGVPGVGDRSLLAAELARLERERAELSLGLPIAMLIGGGVVLASGGMLLLVTALSDAWCSGEDGFDDRCSGPDDAFYAISAVAIVGGGALALVGLLQLLDRGAERRRLGIRIKELRQVLAPAEGYGFYFGPERVGIAARLRF